MGIASSQANAKQISCPGFGDGATAPLDLDRFYAKRAVEIVRAALGNDSKALGSLVQPKAKLNIMRGDYGTSARAVGVEGVLEMVQDIKPTRFQASAVQTGPLSVSTSKCEWSATVLFRTVQPEVGVTVKFDFANGLLVQASGREVRLDEGELR